MRRSLGRRRAGAATTVLSAVLLLCACGGGPSSPADRTTADGKITVVASTNAYGSIAERIGGDKVRVTSIISTASQDPHSYEATAQNKLALFRAQLGIENGGGYDDFFDQLAGGGILPRERILNVVELSGLRTEANKASFNEHVWYSLPTVDKLADVLAQRLADLAPADAATFRANAAAFKASIAPISATLAAVRARHAGEPVAVTEPVPLYLLQAAGLENRTPEQFSRAMEQGSDVPAFMLKTLTDLIRSHGVRLLAYNSQTEGPQTESLKSTAQGAGIPVLGFTETLPAGQDYAGWMRENANTIEQALAK